MSLSYGTVYGNNINSIQEHNEENLNRDNALRRVRGGLFVFFGIAVMVGVWWSGSPLLSTNSPVLAKHSLHDNNNGQKQTTVLSTNSLTISIENEYSLRGDPKITAYPWEIVEPYRDSFLSVSGGQSDSDYVWTITREEDFRSSGYMEIYTGSTITVQFQTPGKYSVLVQEMVNSEVVNYLEKSYMCKYVRREIRSLTEEDRNRYFDAVETLMTVSTEEGKDKFGVDYYDKNWFIREHMYGGAEITCDHWHAGIGFLATHIAFTLQWEKAIQAVDPTVAAHYWDFTIDREALEYRWRESFVFSPDWFGSPRPEEGIVSEGRWAYTPVMMNAQFYSGITNSWNLLRSPWNNDPRPYLTRFETLFKYFDYDRPKGCAEYWGCLQLTNWLDLAACMNGDTHGRIHQLMGGSWGGVYDEFLNHPLLADTPWANNTLVVGSFLIETEAFIKTFWRAGYMTCPPVCAAGTEEKDCQCYCDRSLDIWQNVDPYDLLDDTGIFRKLYNLDSTGFVQRSTTGSEADMVYWLDGKTEEEANIIWQGLIDATCQPGYIGTMYEGESPNDITFWVLHTNMDRLWHWMRLSPYYYGFDDTWIDGKYGDCSGHYQDDIPGNFTNLFDADNKLYTNAELYMMLHPMNDNLQYVYDSFEWAHCAEKGYDFNNNITAWKDSGVIDGGQPYAYELRPTTVPTTSSTTSGKKHQSDSESR